MDVLCVILLIAAGTTAAAREYTAEELSSFPKLFHLDDYERCLANKNGLYCLGVFDLTPDVQPNPTYQLLKEYSDESHKHFNRTRIYRGTCVSSRCPHEAESNASQRFEQCVDKWAKRRTLRASINTFHYCHTHADRHAERATTTAQHIFVQCIYALIATNIIATIYDICTRDTPNKNELITAFSIPANWRRLTAIEESKDPRMVALIPINGIRATSMVISTYSHANAFHYAHHIMNPEFLEKQTQSLDTIFIADGTSLMQGLLMMSCFLTAYNLLVFSQKQPLDLSMLPKCVAKRAIRMLPMSLLLVGYGATYMIHVRDGPLVPTMIGQESRACQSKFWSHMFFMNNMVEATEYCIVPTWFIAVDMHLYIVTCALTLFMYQRRPIALKLYSALFLASCALVALMAYLKDYKSMTYLTSPEAIRRFFRDSPSFTHFYVSSWGALPACFLGLILAHIQFELDERRIKLSEKTWFVYLFYIIFPMNFLWAFTGLYTRTRTSPLFHILHITFNRPIFCIIMAIMLLGLMNVEGPLRKFYSWSGFTRMTRLALIVMLLHWCINMAIATRPAAYVTSMLDIYVDCMATNILTYLLAIVITIMIDMPVQHFLRLLIL